MRPVALWECSTSGLLLQCLSKWVMHWTGSAICFHFWPENRSGRCAVSHRDRGTRSGTGCGNRVVHPLVPYPHQYWSKVYGYLFRWLWCMWHGPADQHNITLKRFGIDLSGIHGLLFIAGNETEVVLVDVVDDDLACVFTGPAPFSCGWFFTEVPQGCIIA